MLTSAFFQGKLKQLLSQTVQQTSVVKIISKPYCLRLFHAGRTSKHIFLSQHEIEEGHVKKEKLPCMLRGLTDPQILYSSYVKDGMARLDPQTLHRIGKRFKLQDKLKRREHAIPLIIEKNIIKPEKTYPEVYDQDKREVKVLYPYANTDQITLENGSECSDSEDLKPRFSVQEEIVLRMEAFEEGILEQLDSPVGNLVADQGTYDINPDNLLDEKSKLQLMIEQQGSADPNYPVSSVPCGGCGAHLHCQQPSLMG